MSQNILINLIPGVLNIAVYNFMTGTMYWQNDNLHNSVHIFQNQLKKGSG